MTDVIADATPLEQPSIRVRDEWLAEMPKDLYIPPDALEVFLETFEGPLDLLLYLIRKQNLDILDIPIAKITAQYMEYIDLMRELQLDLAAEYLVMAAMLAEIKSRLLLPQHEEADVDEEDPRAALIRRLQEYERYKKAAEALNDLPRRGRDTFSALADTPGMDPIKKLPQVELQALLFAFQDVLKRAELLSAHHVQRETLSVRERMSRIVSQLQQGKFLPFTVFFDPSEGRMGVVVTFMAILELFRESIIEVVQSEPFANIHIKAVSVE